MQIAGPDTSGHQIVGQILRHLLGQGGDQHSFVAFGSGPDFPDEVVDLTLGRFEDDLRIHQAGGSDDLLDETVAALQLVGAGGG